MIILVLAALCVYSTTGLIRAPRELVVRIPPNYMDGVVIEPGSYPKPGSAGRKPT